MIRQELSRLFTVEERHRRLLARLLLALGATVVVLGAGTVLTWALEIGDVARFRSVKQAISYCGLCGAEKSSADIAKRTPISKHCPFAAA